MLSSRGLKQRFGHPEVVYVMNKGVGPICSSSSCPAEKHEPMLDHAYGPLSSFRLISSGMCCGNWVVKHLIRRAVCMVFPSGKNFSWAFAHCKSVPLPGTNACARVSYMVGLLIPQAPWQPLPVPISGQACAPACPGPLPSSPASHSIREVSLYVAI